MATGRTAPLPPCAPAIRRGMRLPGNFWGHFVILLCSVRVLAGDLEGLQKRLNPGLSSRMPCFTSSPHGKDLRTEPRPNAHHHFLLLLCAFLYFVPCAAAAPAAASMGVTTSHAAVPFLTPMPALFLSTGVRCVPVRKHPRLHYRHLRLHRRDPVRRGRCFDRKESPITPNQTTNPNGLW